MYNIWVGNRESEILTYKDFFVASITYYGSGKAKNYAYTLKRRVEKKYSDHFKNFVINKIDDLILKYKFVKIHFYNPMFAHKILNEKKDFIKYFANINDYETLYWISSKVFTRLWISNWFDVPRFALLSKRECHYKKLNSLFGNFNDYVIQKHISGGGEGTYKLNIKTENDIIQELNEHSLYLVSPYYEKKYTFCCHILIYRDNVKVFPFGIQTSNEINNQIIYEGSDYIKGKDIPYDIKQDLIDISQNIGVHLSNIGYRGICGFDFILSNEKILFIEVNARYLGSTFIINNALLENGFPSLFELNTDCFSDSPLYLDFQTHDLSINNKSKTYRNNGDIMILKDIKEFLNDKIDNENITFFLDGLDSASFIDKNTYLCREMSKG